MKKQPVFTKNAPAPIGPYSQAILAGDTLYISGQIAIDPKTNELILNDLKSETERVLNNLNAILEAAGMNKSNVVKCSIFLSNMDNFGVINEIYGNFFAGYAPARETVEVARLPKNVNIEISAIAVK